MQTIDFHAHLLNPSVSFDRLYDKIAIRLFAHKLGADKNDLLERKYDAFVDTFIRNIRTSKHVTKSVLLPVDAKVNAKGIELHKDKTVCSSNEDVLKVYQQYPDEIIPFFSINPNRPDALDLIDKYASLGFKGAKFLQNYWDIDINEPKYAPYFAKIKAYDLPLIIHTGSEYSIASNKKFEVIEVAKQAIEIGCKVVLAHFGVNILMESRLQNLPHNFSFKSSKFGDDYFKTINYLEKYPNVYADLAAIIALFRGKIIADLAQNQPQIAHKLLFATDFPVPFSVLLAHHNLGLKKRFEIEKIKNPLDRYLAFFQQYFKDDAPIYTNWQKLIKI